MKYENELIIIYNLIPKDIINLNKKIMDDKKNLGKENIAINIET